MSAVQWVDDKHLNVLSSVHTGAMKYVGRNNMNKNLKKKDTIMDYKMNMRLVDKSAWKLVCARL